MMLLAGIDYSLTCPAICLYCGEIGEWDIERCDFHYLTKIKKYAGINEYMKPRNRAVRVVGHEYPTEYEGGNENDCGRYDALAEWAIGLVEECSGVALEDYAYGATGKVFHIAENGGILKHRLWKWSIPCLLVEPTVVKKFGTGRGNAKKLDMHEAFKKETGVDLWKKITPAKKDVGNPTSDMVDAYYICKWLHDFMLEVQ